MTKYAQEATEVLSWTPPSLASIPNPPVLLLKPGTRRERRIYSRMLVEEGLRLHSQAAFRDETIKGLKELWSPEIFAENEGRLKAYWDAFDQHQRDNEGAKDPSPFDHPDREPVEEMSRRITRAWAPLREMAADIISYNEDAPAVMVAILLAGWKNIDLPFLLVEGTVPLDRVEDLEARLEAVENDPEHRKIEGVQPGLAAMQLRAKCAERLFLTEAERKNSASPSLSISTPQPSTENGAVEEAGTSAASDISTETPAS